MENPEEILHSLEEFSKMKPKDIPRELEEYLSFVAKTGDPIYQWPAIKSLFREKLINVVTEFYESCPSVEIPQCPNVELFNYDLMKNFILEKLDTFSAAPFTLQRICELLTTPRKEYNRIDKYMRALEKNILVVSTTEPGHKGSENGDSIMNGIEADYPPEPSNEINVEEMDDSPSWSRSVQTAEDVSPAPFEGLKIPGASSSDQETVISCAVVDDQRYVSIEPVTINLPPAELEPVKDDVSVTITAVATPPVEEVVVDVSEPVAPEIVLNEDIPTSEPEPQEVVKEYPVHPLEAQQKTEVKTPTEECGIENISPETSTSSPENFQPDTSSVTEKVDATKTEESSPVEEPKEPVLDDEKASGDAEKPSEESAVSTAVVPEQEELKEEEEKLGRAEDLPLETVEEPAVKIEENVSESDTKSEETEPKKEEEIALPDVEIPMDIDSVKSDKTAEVAAEQTES